MSVTSPRSFLHSLTTQQHARTGNTRASTDIFADKIVSRSTVMDVWELAAQFPDRWAKLMHEAPFNADAWTIQQFFMVSERTAYRWLAGKGGVRTPHHLVAQREAPEEYDRLILARAA